MIKNILNVLVVKAKMLILLLNLCFLRLKAYESKIENYLKNVSNPLSCHSEKVESLYDPVTAQANKGNFFVTVIKLLIDRNH